MCEGVILHVTYTERGERIQIISARRAERHEQDRYYRQNACDGTVVEVCRAAPSGRSRTRRCGR